MIIQFVQIRPKWHQGGAGASLHYCHVAPLPYCHMSPSLSSPLTALLSSLSRILDSLPIKDPDDPVVKLLDNLAIKEPDSPAVKVCAAPGLLVTTHKQY